MPHKVMSGRPLAQEVKRLLDQELLAATSGLTQPSTTDCIRCVHDTRKHIKKARALLQLMRRPLGGRYRDADYELRTANRAIGPAADARRLIETLNNARRAGTVPLPSSAFADLRRALESRASALEESATIDDLRARAARLLTSLRQELLATDLSSLDRQDIGGEIRVVHAAARKARRRATSRPSVDAYHRWRRRVKREWHLLRLISNLTGNRLADERHQLAALDMALGELHDVEVLTSALLSNPAASRRETARVIAALRTDARERRRRAVLLSSVLDERPRDLARRARALWGVPARRPHAARAEPWPHSA